MESGISKKYRFILRLSGVLLYLGLLLGISIFFESSKAKTLVHQYMHIWEDDIASAKIFKSDISLQNKVLDQLFQVHSSVSDVSTASSLQKCWSQVSIPLSYNALPAGQVQVCFDAAKTSFIAMSSPVFLLGLLLGIVFWMLSVRKEVNNQVRAQRLQTELHFNQEMAKMSRQVAHDIRGPLTALMTLSKLGHDETSEKQQLLHLAAERIQGIADDLLKQGTKEKQSLAPVVNATTEAAISLREETRNIIREYRFANSHISIELHEHLGESSDLVKFEKIKFQRILSNILNNAIEALPEAEPNITITLMAKSKGLMLLVMDNGCGIPEEEISKVLEEGYSYQKKTGSGLGLYDAAKTLIGIGGDLQVTSRLGIGTQILLVFPYAELSSATRIS